jgi:hypothetical protein
MSGKVENPGHLLKFIVGALTLVVYDLVVTGPAIDLPYFSGRSYGG